MREDKPTHVLPVSLELKNDAVARMLAQTMADESGKTITVRDEDGNEVVKVKPTPKH